ncbi:putative disease resistance protein RGA1 [Corylus avellana]|uniref:putative disease resistance protein RGA1 n=1 Tax=Corylus avellana TaxID=13451 RepID=UPI00286BC427|nr:putative disease resistance protein RGA1 [Corylus avellana]
MSLLPVVAQLSETTPYSSSPFSDLSKLKSLFLAGLEELQYLPQEWLQNLTTSLERLKISQCRKLRISMSSLFQHLTVLEDLVISNCRELIFNEDEEEAAQLADQPDSFYVAEIIDDMCEGMYADAHHNAASRSKLPQRLWEREEDTHSFVLNEEVIGREDEKEDVKELLLDSTVEENVSIIPIVGIGGLGKTTLAKYVFNDEQVQRHFDLKVWVCVSDPFNVKTIVQKLIESATKKRPESFEMDPLQSELRVIIGGKRFLLILDDVWNENRDRWLNLKTLLVGGLRGSKVLITTRSAKVAKITGTVSPYLLGGLSENNSWDLFKKMAFKNGEEPKNIELVKIGREIVRKCAWVPLAIRSIGSILYFKNSQDDWLYFKNNELLKVTQQENDIFPILKLSYDHLSLHLKQCFAFCSLFPKDSKIKVEVLIKLWIAQGFIHSSDRNRRLEDAGHEYFMDLLWRSFFQEPYTNAYGDIESCKMHDLIHDFAQSVVAGNECIIVNPNSEDIVERTRHVAFDPAYSFSDIPAPLLKANKIRTLLLQLPIVNRDFIVPAGWNKSIFDTLISSFKCLRALNLSNLNIQEVPNFIGKLKHLRFLDLSRNGGIKLLPTSITKLQNLQTLNLENCSGLTELPEDMSNLISLRHLEIDGCSLTHMPRGLKKLTSLNTLSYYILGKKENHVLKLKGGLSELNGLNELRGKLCIKGLEHLRSYPVEAKAANLERKQYLQDLELLWDPEADEADDDIDKVIANDEQLLQNFRPHLNLKRILIVGYAGVGFSSCRVSSLSNLVHLIIKSCRWCQHIPPLNQFPFLKHLYLYELSALEYLGNNESDVSSSSLESICLEDLPKLKGWWRMRETATAEHEPHHHLQLFPSFPCLSYLDIDNCPLMSLIPAVAPGSETTPSSSYPFSNLSKLNSLYLGRLEELEYLPEEWLQNLTSLKNLRIWECRKLRISMSPLFQHLTALEYLGINECGELISNEDEEGAQCFGPTRLRRLCIENVTSLVSLPRELRHATTLQWLDIKDCPTLMSLPEWIGDFTSLKTLQIFNCPNLISLPEGMHRLTSLRNLTIVACPR